MANTDSAHPEPAAPRGNAGLGSCPPLVTTFLKTGQSPTLFYGCFRLKMPDFTCIVDSFTPNPRPAALSLGAEGSWSNTRFLREAHGSLHVCANSGQLMCTLPGGRFRQRGHRRRGAQRCEQQGTNRASRGALVYGPTFSPLCTHVSGSDHEGSRGLGGGGALSGPGPVMVGMDGGCVSRPCA